MLAFAHHYSTVLFSVAAVLTIGGFVRFVVQVARWDPEYENFLIFPLRLAIYLIAYLFIPGLGIAVGGAMMRSPKRVNWKFGNASIYTSIVGLLLWISSFGAAIR